MARAIRPYLIATLLTGAAMHSPPFPSACGAELYSYYAAGLSGAAFAGPGSYGWTASIGDSIGKGVFNSGQTGYNAWRIEDAASTSPNPYWFTDFGSTALATATTRGWKFSAFARYAEDVVGPNLGLSAYLNGREYHLMLDLDEAKNLRVTLNDEFARTYVVTKGGQGVDAFHNFTLAGRPSSSLVDLYFDGELVNRDAGWDGTVRPNHGNFVLWGNSNYARSGQGSLDVHYVSVQLGPFNDIPGDFDLNGRFDARDFLSWQRRAGSTRSPLVDFDGDGVITQRDLTVWEHGYGAQRQVGVGNLSVPEPTVSAMLLGAVLALWRPVRAAGPCSRRGATISAEVSVLTRRRRTYPTWPRQA
ncbi:MAG: hypothetical protein KDA61_12915 [Planctomycetales bacterium]|nr:hypothetical protein [Planctomycetales bacterium]